MAFSELDAELLSDDAYDEVRFTGADLAGSDDPDDRSGSSAAGSRFLDCVVEDADLTGARLGATRWTDCRWTRVRGAGVELADAALQDVVVEEARLGAPAAYGSTWRRVTVRGGKVDFLNLRGARLQEVAFEDCVLVEPDFAGATLTGVTFHGCTLQSAQWSGATLTRVDLSEASVLAPQGVTSLRGAMISRPQLIDLADVLASQLGIVVVDRR